MTHGMARGRARPVAGGRRSYSSELLEKAAARMGSILPVDLRPNMDRNRMVPVLAANEVATPPRGWAGLTRSPARTDDVEDGRGGAAAVAAATSARARPPKYRATRAASADSAATSDARDEVRADAILLALACLEERAGWCRLDRRGRETRSVDRSREGAGR